MIDLSNPFPSYQHFHNTCSTYFSASKSRPSSDGPGSYGVGEVDDRLARKQDLYRDMRRGWTFSRTPPLDDPRLERSGGNWGWFYKRIGFVLTSTEEGAGSHGPEGDNEMEEMEEDLALNETHDENHSSMGTLGSIEPARSRGLRRPVEMGQVEWYITYHPTYRIPWIMFSASHPNGQPLSLKEMIGDRVIRVPDGSLFAFQEQQQQSSSSSSSPSSSPSPLQLQSSLPADQTYLPLNDTSSFPLLIQTPHPGVKGMILWALDPCETTRHIGEVVQSQVSERHEVGDDAGGNEEEEREMWMSVWMGMIRRVVDVN